MRFSTATLLILFIATGLMTAVGSSTPTKFTAPGQIRLY